MKGSLFISQGISRPDLVQTMSDTRDQQLQLVLLQLKKEIQIHIGIEETLNNLDQLFFSHVRAL